MKQAFAHEAELLLEAAGDTRAPGGAITLALCGSYDHAPPCPLAPHHTSATPNGETLRLRVLFAAEPEQEPRVRDLITQALQTGALTGPDGTHTRWRLQSSGPAPMAPHEQAHAERLIAS